MECYPSHPSSSSSTPSSLLNSFESFKQWTVKAALESFLPVFLGLSYAVVGTFSGAITGAIIGLENHSGLFCGAAVGALLGALSSIEEVFECFRRLRLPDGKGINCLLDLINVLGNLICGRLVRDRVGSMLTNDDVLSQLENEDSIFETVGCKGLALERVGNIPTIKITTKNIIDSLGHSISCSICLQDFEVGQIVRNLPYCHHMFHPTCIDQWLIKHGSCPLCRKSV
ncbi:hypothetical protein ACHQM5_015993 [Ranunculus cassubicifolius]